MYLEALRLLVLSHPKAHALTQRVRTLWQSPAIRLTASVVVVLLFVTATYAQTPNTDAFFNKISALVNGGFGKGIALFGFLLGAILIFLNQISAGMMILLGAFLLAFSTTIVNFIFNVSGGGGGGTGTP